MGKIQPNFSWQKYEKEGTENEGDQFQYQLQKEHLVVSDSVNGTIDDLSYLVSGTIMTNLPVSELNLPVERATAWIWVDTSQIFKMTLPTATWVLGGGFYTNTIIIPIVGNFLIVYMQCCISDGNLSTSNTLNLPHIDVSVSNNSVEIVRNGTNINLKSVANYSAFSGYVTIYYVKYP